MAVNSRCMLIFASEFNLNIGFITERVFSYDFRIESNIFESESIIHTPYFTFTIFYFYIQKLDSNYFSRQRAFERFLGHSKVVATSTLTASLKIPVSIKISLSINTTALIVGKNVTHSRSNVGCKKSDQHIHIS